MPIADLLVIGGGIHGVCVARDAARRGLAVTLIEKGDLAQGTSQRSSKLVHGGLRYLETGQIELVKEALAERATWLRIAPKLVKPQPFLLPFVRGEGRPAWKVTLGLRMYDLLARDSPLPKHERLTADEAMRREPALPAEGLEGAALYYDAAMDDAAIVLACAMDAATAGATVRTRTPVTGLARVGSGEQAMWRVWLAGGETIEARRVVNAAGAWADVVRKLAGTFEKPSIRPSRGAHVVVPALTREHALLLFAHADGRVFFVIPAGGSALVGTTDTDHAEGPEAAGPRAEDVRYLWSELRARWPERAETLADDTRRVFAGLRALARAQSAFPWANPREARLLDEVGMITITGGKYTTARRLAERVVDKVFASLERTVAPCDTATALLPDPRIASGTPTADVVAFAIEKTFARGVGDVVWRRSGLWRDRAAARAVAPAVADLLAAKFRWTSEQKERELAAFLAECDAEERVIAEAREEA